MRFLLEISTEAVGSQNLKGPEQDKQPEPLVEMLLVDLGATFQSA